MELETTLIRWHRFFASDNYTTVQWRIQVYSDDRQGATTSATTVPTGIYQRPSPCMINEQNARLVL